jgi:FkbM family methyltransferase
MYLKLKKYRPLDINLNIGISKKENIASYFRFNNNTLNTFSQKEKTSYLKSGYSLIDTLKIQCKTLDYLFKNYVKNNEVDFLSLDSEGTELDILKSNDWKINRPKFLIVETIKHKPLIKCAGKISKFLYSKNYFLFADTFINSIYISKEYLNIKEIRFL